MLTKFTRKELKRWTDALRSGSYMQCSLLLNSAGKFCALGVLCDLNRGDMALTVEGVSTFYEGHAAVLPEKMCHKYGIDNIGSFGGDNFSVAHFNVEMMPFPDIATLIETHYETID
jgi:hypothetical protein